jgi:hypothetical protein
MAVNRQLTGFAYEKITPGDTATGITAGNITTDGGSPAVAVLITCEGATAHFTTHGTNPTAAAGTNIGHAIEAGQSILLEGTPNIDKLKFIDRVSGSASTVKLTFMAE